MSFSGWVRGAPDAAPLAGAAVRWRIVNNYIDEVCASTITDASGAFSVTCRFASGMLPFGAHSYYQDITLDGYAPRTIHLGYFAAPETVADQEVLLERTGVLEVFAMNSATGLGVPGVDVVLDRDRNAVTDASGHAVFELPPGSYQPCVEEVTASYLPECLGGEPRGNRMLFERGAAVDITPAGHVRVVISLDVGAALTGTVMDRRAGVPLAHFQMSLTFYGLQGQYLGQSIAATDGEGRYRLEGAGDSPMLVEVHAWQPYPWYASQMFPSLDCLPSCNLEMGVPGEFLPGSTEQMDFALWQPVIGGMVRDADTDAALDGVTLIVSNGSFSVRSEPTGEDGRWQIAGLQPLSEGFGFSLQSENASGYIDLEWPDVPCPADCGEGEWLYLDDGVDRTDLDFALQRGATLAGTTVQRSVEGNVTVYLRDSERMLWSRRYVRGGEFVTPPLLPGTYTLQAASRNHCAWYEDAPCSPDGEALAIPIVVGTDGVAGLAIRMDPEAIFISGF